MTSDMQARATGPLPITLEEITPQWLTHAFRQKFPGVSIERAEIVDMIRGTCTKIRLRLEPDQAGRDAGIPPTVILKGGFEPHSREMCHMHQVEALAYGEVIPAYPLQSPECYFAGYDAQRRQGIVIIEDLVARGVRFCHPQTPQSFVEVARRLSALAAFHAQTWGSPELEPGGRWGDTHNVIAAFAPYMGQFFREDIWRGWIESPRGAAVSVCFHDMHWMRETLDKLVSFSAPLPRCLIHGDTHLGNLYVDPDGTPGFFDPQTHQSPAMYEVAYHVAGALDTADRARWERPLVQHYLVELARHGVAAPGLDAAMHQYAAYLALGYCIFLVNANDFQTEAVNTAYTARFSAAMLDNNTLEVLAAIPAG
ncbi:phosphotransferase [Haliea sp. E17]|uniref:phosphotransferase n=1 Tax=Haliea sp. E17 TaxID=3401576 RepID=UPI003AAF4CBD